MALVFSLHYNLHHQHHLPVSVRNPSIKSAKFSCNEKSQFNLCFSTNRECWRQQWVSWVVDCSENESSQSGSEDKEVNNLGVKAALSMLRFYKREISPLLPKSCRFVPTCSEYSMIAYKKYGVVKGTILTAWRLCRCNPLGGSGFDPPRWFDETSPPER